MCSCMAGGDGGPCGCEVLGCRFDVGDAPGDDGGGVSAAELSLVRRRGDRICDLCCLLLDRRCDLAWVHVGTIRSTEPSTPPDRHHNRRRSFPPPRLRPPYSPRHSTSGVVRIRRDAPTRSPRRRPPCCKTTRNRYIPSKYSKDPRRLDPPPTAATRPMVSPALAVPFEWVSEGVEAAVVGRVING